MEEILQYFKLFINNSLNELLKNKKKMLLIKICENKI